MQLLFGVYCHLPVMPRRSCHYSIWNPDLHHKLSTSAVSPHTHTHARTEEGGGGVWFNQENISSIRSNVNRKWAELRSSSELLSFRTWEDINSEINTFLIFFTVVLRQFLNVVKNDACIYVCAHVCKLPELLFVPLEYFFKLEQCENFNKSNYG